MTLSSVPSANLLTLLERLIALETAVPHGNLSLIELAADHLSACGAAVRWSWSDDRTKANLFATIGPTDRPGLMLSGHTDVVPAGKTGWSSDPFRLTQRDDRLYGRGTSDMKGFVAAMLALAPACAAQPLALPIHFALTYDEEIGCIGVRRLIEDLRDVSPRPRLCVVGEPTGMQVVTGHKGRKAVRVRVDGHPCHSSLNDRGVNAIEFAAELVVRLRAMQQRLRATGPFAPGYDPPYTTLHTGLIQGGRALNIVPDRCSFDFEIRNLPEHDPEALMAEMRGWAQDLVPEMLAVSEEAGFLFEEHTTAGLTMADEDPAVCLALALAEGGPTARVSYGTEAGLFQQAGFPTVVCGPGDIAQAHKADEFISLDQLGRGEAFLHRLLDFARAPS